MFSPNWTHRSLCEDLAVAKETIFVEVPLGSPYAGFYRKMGRVYELIRGGLNVPEAKKRATEEGHVIQQADVACVKPSYNNFCIDIFEVKRTRSDFLKEIKTEKWRGYLDHCHRFYFACLSGVCKKEELPPEAGLYIRGDNGWKCSKRAEPQKTTVPRETLLSMLFYKQKEEPNIRARHYMTYRWHDVKALKKKGREVSKALSFYNKHKDKMPH